MSESTEIPDNFKTCLPPRKRAKTKEEKEQRRIERILRNRKAAHASREKKRKHVEFLESYVVDLETQMNMVKQLNSRLLLDYTGGSADVDLLLKKIAVLPDLKESKRQHVSELDLVDAEVNGDVDDEMMPKTPESCALSLHADEDVPMLDKSRMDSMSEASGCSPQFSPVTTPSSGDRFSLDIISGEPEMSFDCTSATPFSDIFVKKEVDEFIPQIPEMATFDKMGLDDYRVNTNDNEFDLVELRNPAVIAVVASSWRESPFIRKSLACVLCMVSQLGYLLRTQL